MRAWSLADEQADLRCTWVPGAGMLGASLMHGGDELLWQGAGVHAYARERKFMGIPFLHPWANRLDRFAYDANGHHVVLDPDSPLLLLDDHGLPIHGVLTGSRRWVVREVTADSDRATLVSSLDFDRPDLLEAFPFPHRVELAVEVSGGAVQVRTTLTATGSEAVPVTFGFHPYFTLPGLPRARWDVVFPVHERLPLDPRMVPTGATEPASPSPERSASGPGTTSSMASTQAHAFNSAAAGARSRSNTPRDTRWLRSSRRLARSTSASNR